MNDAPLLQSPFGLEKFCSDSSQVKKMEGFHEDQTTNPGLQLIRYSPFQPYTKFSSPCLNLRVFYVRISKFQVGDSASEFLTLNHIPLSPDTLLEVNGVRSCRYSDGVSLLLRRDRVDKVSEEATFVSTDSIRLTGSVKFEIFHKKDRVLRGSIDMSNENNGFGGESKGNNKRWSMNCESEIGAGTAFAKGIYIGGPELGPTIEVYVAGSFSGDPIVLTKTLNLSLRRKYGRKFALDSIPENVSAEDNNDRTSLEQDLQVAECAKFRQENEEEEEEEYYNRGNMKWGRADWLIEEEEEGELSWFNAGVRVGVGIGLGICLGVGVGVGLLVKSYKATTRSFKRSLI